MSWTSLRLGLLGVVGALSLVSCGDPKPQARKVLPVRKVHKALRAPLGLKAHRVSLAQPVQLARAG